MDTAKIELEIARLELSRLESEHQYVLNAVERTIQRLCTEPGDSMQEAILLDLQAAIVYRVGDDGQDRLLQLACL